ncbi:MAG: HNH endonuclease [Sandaracinaceae bacterium]|nr:HNH endonuclease [Sandaracinaceae bacterium]
MLRHGRPYALPGCTHSAFTHIHHVTPRSECGTRDPERLVPVCTSHHLAAHRGALFVRGSFSGGFRFFHADGRPFVGPSGSSLRTVPDESDVIVAADWIVDLGPEGGEGGPAFRA